MTTRRNRLISGLDAFAVLALWAAAIASGYTLGYVIAVFWTARAIAVEWWWPRRERRSRPGDQTAARP